MKNTYRIVGSVAAALAGALLLAPAPSMGQAQGPTLTVLDREGKLVRTIDGAQFRKPAYSPDRTRVAGIAGGNVVVLDVATGRVTPVASQVENDTLSLAWSSDGSQLAYAALRGSYFGIYRKAATGEGDEELLYRHSGLPFVTDWSADGRYLGFYTPGESLFALPLDGGAAGARDPIEILRLEFGSLLGPFFSPDGRFVAYQSDESGRNEIWVRVFDPSGQRAAGRRRISTDGALRGSAGMLSWRQDGKELYYVAADGGVMAVEVSTIADFTSSRPRLLFKAPPILMIAGVGTFPTGTLGNLSNDGQQFLFAVPPLPPLRQITVFDGYGKVVSRVAEPGLYGRAALSPDGSKVAVLKADPRTGIQSIWTFDVAGGRSVQVTADDYAVRDGPIWSVDGTQVAYVSTRENGRHWGIYTKAESGEGPEDLLFRNPPGVPLGRPSFSGNGRFLTFDAGGYLSVVPLTGIDPLAREAIEYSGEEFLVGEPLFSPDSRFLVYFSEESGRPEYYVRPFDAASGRLGEGKWQISQGGVFTLSLAWRRDGKEIFYATGATIAGVTGPKVMAVEVTTTPTFQAGEPRILFTLPFGPQATQLTHDGQLFVALVPLPAPADPVR